MRVSGLTGVVATWSDTTRVGTITQDGGGTITFVGAVIRAMNPMGARYWRSIAKARLPVGQRVRFNVNGSDATIVIPDPHAKLIR